MRFILGALVIIFNFMDNFTTFACLRAPVAGFEITEANPVAHWLFSWIGLAEGLILEMLITMGAVAFLMFTRRLPNSTRLLLLGILAVLPAIAAVNNLDVMYAIGISL